MLTRWYDIDRNMAALDAASRQMDRLFGDLWTGRAARLDRTFPRANLADEGSRLLATLEVPGLDEERLQVEVLGDALIVSGERSSAPPEGYRVHRAERAAWSGRFTRTFGLPCRVDPERTTATLREGLLTITMEKHAEAKPRQIAVSAG